MTGYGSAHRTDEGVSYALELRSLNNRYLKSSVRLPEYLQFLEADVDKLLRSRLGRGSVMFSLRIRDESAGAAIPINQAALQSYLEQLSDLERPAGVPVTIDLAGLAELPGVCQQPELDDEARSGYWGKIQALTTEALDALIEMRSREGESLRKDLLSHCEAIRENLKAIAALAPTVVQEYRDKLAERVNALLSTAALTLEEDALAREVALFADRCDISEEITRLTSHLDQFSRFCDSAEPAGRKLDFLAQELLREVNTIGSKSNNAAITWHVVDIKSLIDRLKEQVQNVE